MKTNLSSIFLFDNIYKKVSINTHKLFLISLLAFFLFSASHTLLHNSFDHHHDHTCAVYVLEEFFISQDIAVFSLEERLFIPYVHYLLPQKPILLSRNNHFSIRAPPSSPLHS